MVDFAGDRIFSDDYTGDHAPNVRDLMQYVNEASHSFGKDIDVAQHHKKRLIDAGFRNVREEVYKVRPSNNSIHHLPSYLTTNPHNTGPS